MTCMPTRLVLRLRGLPLLVGLLAASCSAYDAGLVGPTSGKSGSGPHGGAGVRALDAGAGRSGESAADSGGSGNQAGEPAGMGSVAGAGSGGRTGNAGQIGAGSGGTAGASGSSGRGAGTGGAGSGGAGTGGAGIGGSAGNAGTSAAAGGIGGNGGAGTAGGAGSSGDAGPCMSDAGMDCCPSDPLKVDPGVCGCAVPDSDVDFDGLLDCNDPSLGWQKAVTFDGSQVDANLSAFPVLVRLTDSELGARAASNGTDIYFVDQAQTMTLAHEVERYDGSTGSLVAWVLLPTLTAATDSVIYLRYGDGGTNRSQPATLWTGHYYVWHLAQDPGPAGAGDIRDSTGRAHGTAQTNMLTSDLVDAVAGKGIHFDGSDDEITFNNSFTGTGPSTLSAWVNQQTDNDGKGDAIVAFGGTAMTDQVRALFSTQVGTHDIVGSFYNDDVDSSTSIEGAGWRYVAWVWDGSNSRFYVNGVLVSGPTAHGGADTMGTGGKVGNATWAARNLRGQLDEVRVSSATRPAAWFKAEYNNQRANSTFLKSLGTQQGVSAH
jgi:hypothetical protein